MKKFGFFVLTFFLLSVLSSVFSWSVSAYSAAGDSLLGSVSRGDLFYADYLFLTEQQYVSLDLEEVKLNNVLKMFSQETGLNFVSSEAVRDRSITVYLDRVPFKKAIDIIFRANNLTYEYYPEARMFVVKELGMPERELKTKVYHLRHARVISSFMQTEIEERLQEEGGEDRIDIKKAVESVLTDAGKVVANSFNNSLIVTDAPSRFPVIDYIVAELDVPAVKVMIEVEILDVSKGDIDELGVNWPATLAKLNVSGTRWTKFPFGSRGTSGKGGTWDAEKGTLSDMWEFKNMPAGQFSPSILTVIGADINFDFLKTQADAKFLARPRILTLANHTAEIKIVTDEAIGVSRTRSEDEITYEIERTETGTMLRVTPQVELRNRDITLYVEIINKQARDSGFRTGEEGFITGTIKDPEERSTKGTTRLNDGETLLIGGLIREDSVETQSKIPFLSDIPLMGGLFRHKHKDTSERELMIFLTPRIVEDRDSLVGRDRPMTPLRREQPDLSRKDSIGTALERFNIR